MDGIVSGAGSDEGLKVAYIGVAYKPVSAEKTSKKKKGSQ